MPQRLELLDQIPSITVRQHDVADHQVELARPHKRQSLLETMRDLYRVATALQYKARDKRRVSVIFDEQYSSRGMSHKCRTFFACWKAHSDSERINGLAILCQSMCRERKSALGFWQRERGSIHQN